MSIDSRTRRSARPSVPAMIAAERKSDASMAMIWMIAAPAMSPSVDHSHNRTGRRAERLKMDVAELKQRLLAHEEVQQAAQLPNELILAS
ncbi:hypothetical protein M433DRAFT_10640 [Acidomyces richmondensis BFW]|nr:hypothetical protein M433DRAFT_10640 [Acidomyces richmondensis BFW]